MTNGPKTLSGTNFIFSFTYHRTKNTQRTFPTLPGVKKRTYARRNNHNISNNIPDKSLNKIKEEHKTKKKRTLTSLYTHTQHNTIHIKVCCIVVRVAPGSAWHRYVKQNRITDIIIRTNRHHKFKTSNNNNRKETTHLPSFPFLFSLYKFTRLNKFSTNS